MSDVEQKTGAVDAARGLSAVAAEYAAEAERERRLPQPLVDQIAGAGLFRLCVPLASGGLEATPTVLVEAVEALAQGDGAAGWCVAVNATSGLLGGFLPEDAAREVYGSPKGIAGGVFAPRGRAVPVDGGFRVSGRWPFASGCQHCDWLMGGCVVEGAPPLESGAPDVRLMLAPANEWSIKDTWYVSGLRGTGSHDIELDDVFVPAGRSASLFTTPPVQQGPLYRFALFGLLALAIAGVSIGLARGALDDIVALATRKTPTGSRRNLADRAATQAEIARAEAQLLAARAFLFDAIDLAWQAALERGEVPVELRTGLRLAATHAAVNGAEVVDAAYRLAGGSAIYETSPLQRRFRDAHAATQHMLVAPTTWELTGRLLLGLPTDTAQL